MAAANLVKWLWGFIVQDRTLILASASPRRRQLLSEMGLRFEVLPGALPEPEQKPKSVSPQNWAEALAYYKARSVAEKSPGRWVLGADTVVACDRHMLGKPNDLADARDMLELQAGRASEVITGICLIRLTDQIDRILQHDLTTVWMRDAAEQREDYLQSGDWQGKAGAYGIQDIGDSLVERIAGSFSNVVGLPRGLVSRILRQVNLMPNVTDRRRDSK